MISHCRKACRSMYRHIPFPLLMTAVFLAGMPAASYVQQGGPDSFERLSLEEGLSQSIVSVIHKDRRGLMWFGTQSGLNRFDGYTFKVFKHLPFDSTSISGNDISSITENKYGFLWIGTSTGGLNRMSPRTETFTSFRHDPENPNSIGSNQVGYDFEDLKRQVWVCTTAGAVDRLNLRTGRVHRYRHSASDPRSISNDRIRFVTTDASREVWFGTAGGLNRYDGSTDSFVRYLHDPSDPESLGFDDVAYIYESPGEAGILWIGTADPDHLTKGGGLNRLNVKTGKFRRYMHNPSDPRGLSGSHVRTMYEDPTGVLWIGTELGGLTKINHFGRKFELRSADPRDPAPLSNGLVRAVLVDRAGYLWIGVLQEGLNRYSPDRKSVRHYRPDPERHDALPNGHIWALCEDRAGRIWVGTLGGGLCRFDRETETFTTYSHDPKNPRSIASNFIRAIFEDSEGHLWIGTESGGLELYNQASDSFIHFRHAPQNPVSLGANSVRAVAQDAGGTIRVGTFGGGLNCFNPRLEEFRHLTEENSDLPNNVIYAVLCDDSGRIWCSSNRGLSRYDPEAELIANYDVADGLQSMEFNGQAAFMARNGEMFFGGINGYNSFFPDSIPINPGMPLGAFDEFAYQDARLDLNPGDTLLILSDGLPELFNERMEMYDYDRVGETFRSCGHLDAGGIIEELVKSADVWRNGRIPNDDITFVVLKRKNGFAKDRI